MSRYPTKPLPGLREEDLPPEPNVDPEVPRGTKPKPKPPPRSPRQVRETVDRHGKPKQRYSREHVFPDGRDVVLMRATRDGRWQRLPEPTEDAPTSGVPRFETRAAAAAWLRGEGSRALGGSQVAVMKVLDYVLVEVLNIPTTRLVKMPKGGTGSFRIEPKSTEVKQVPLTDRVDPGAS